MGFTYRTVVILAALDCESNYHCTTVSDFFHKFCKRKIITCITSVWIVDFPRWIPCTPWLYFGYHYLDLDGELSAFSSSITISRLRFRALFECALLLCGCKGFMVLLLALILCVLFASDRLASNGLCGGRSLEGGPIGSLRVLFKFLFSFLWEWPSKPWGLRLFELVTIT